MRVIRILLWRVALLTVFVFIDGSSALSCFICGENNLEEFGECGRQFSYDCGNYAKRFPTTERIFCRTLRQKALNNTYTVMKECISERDHYLKFPRKEYPLEEECDLIDVQGNEVAYCLCKHSDLCNEKPIADQFVAFEELHPELFGDVPAENNQESELVPIQPANLPPALRQKGQAQAPVESNLRRQPSVTGAERRDGPHSGENSSPFAEPINEGLKTRTNSAPVQLSSHSQNGHIRTFVDSTILDSGRERALGATVQTVTDGVVAGEHLLCMQCGERNLKDELADCSKQIIVSCSNQRGGGRPLCFSRQLLIGPGQNAVEKMCVTERALVEEYGTNAPLRGCSGSTEQRIRFCVCDSNECNRASISEQAVFASEKLPSATDADVQISTPQRKKAEEVRCHVCNENSLRDATSDCSKPILVDCSRQSADSERSEIYCLSRRTRLSEGVFSLEKRCISKREFGENFPDEKFPQLGCATVFDGLVTYCVCSGNECNRESVDVQMRNDPNYLPETTVIAKQGEASSTSRSAVIQPASIARRVDGPSVPSHSSVDSLMINSFNVSEVSAVRTTEFNTIHDFTVAPVPATTSTKRKFDEEDNFMAHRHNAWREDPLADGAQINRPFSAHLLLSLTISVIVSAALL